MAEKERKEQQYWDFTGTRLPCSNVPRRLDTRCLRGHPITLSLSISHTHSHKTRAQQTLGKMKLKLYISIISKSCMPFIKAPRQHYQSDIDCSETIWKSKKLGQKVFCQRQNLFYVPNIIFIHSGLLPKRWMQSKCTHWIAFTGKRPGTVPHSRAHNWFTKSKQVLNMWLATANIAHYISCTHMHTHTHTDKDTHSVIFSKLNKYVICLNFERCSLVVFAMMCVWLDLCVGYIKV